MENNNLRKNKISIIYPDNYMFRRVWSSLSGLRSNWLPIFCGIFVLQVSVFAQPHKVGSVSRYVDQTEGLAADEVVKRAFKYNDSLASLVKDAEADEKLINQAKQRAKSNISVNGLQQTLEKVIATRFKVQFLSNWAEENRQEF